MIADEDNVCPVCGQRWRDSSETSEAASSSNILGHPHTSLTKRAQSRNLQEVGAKETAIVRRPSPTRLDQKIVELLVVPAVLLVILAVKLWLSLQYRLAIWDGYSYLSNARAFLLGRTPSPYHFFELLRPPVFPYLISLVWRITGQNYDVATLVQPTFAVAAAYVLFLLLKDAFNLKTATVGGILLAVAPTVFTWTNEILAHGVAMFFLTLAVYLLWLGMERNEWFLPLAGISLALSTLTRYDAFVFVPAFLVVLLSMWIAHRERRSFPWVGLILMVFAFAALWFPWLYWNYLYEGGPFASMISGYLTASGTEPGPWYFYFVNMPDLLTVPGTILLVIGLADKGIFKDRVKLAFLLWLATFLALYSLLPEPKDDHYAIMWTPALVVFAAIGFSRVEVHLPSKAKILAWVLLGLWLTSTFYSGVGASISEARIQIALYGSVDEFNAVSAWITTNTSPTVNGATDIPTALSYSTDRNFANIYYYDEVAPEMGMSVDQFLSHENMTLIVVTSGTAQSLGFPHDPNFNLLKQFPDYDIYAHQCLNCTGGP